MLHICIFLFLTLGMAAAVPQDMSGKMLVFPEEGNVAHVRLTTSRQNLGVVTVCMRYFTDLTRTTSFFSMSTPSHSDEFVIYRKNSDFLIIVQNIQSTFKLLDFQANRWQSVCATWDSNSGLAQLWLDGKPSSLKSNSKSSISGPMLMVLGQDQDSYGGTFEVRDCFVGMISDIHMWDYVLPPLHIDNYNQKFNFPAGNIINWKSIDFQIKGEVFVQNEQRICNRAVVSKEGAGEEKPPNLDYKSNL